MKAQTSKVSKTPRVSRGLERPDIKSFQNSQRLRQMANGELIYPSFLSVTQSYDGKQLITAVGRAIIQWDLRTGQRIRPIKGHRADVLAVDILPRARRLISASADHLIKTWIPTTGKGKCILSGHAGDVTSLVIMKSGCYAFSSSHDHTIKVWNLFMPESTEHLKGTSEPSMP